MRDQSVSKNIHPAALLLVVFELASVKITVIRTLKIFKLKSKLVSIAMLS